MTEEIMVLKRDGNKEPFNAEKISKVVQAAGLRPIDADQLASNVEKWIRSLKQPTVSSLKIRDKVFEHLDKTDKYASGLYAWYQNLKDSRSQQSSSLPNDKI